MNNTPALDRIEPIACRSSDGAKALGVSLRTFQSLLAAGAIPSAKVGRVRLVPVAALRAWLEAQVEKGARQ